MMRAIQLAVLCVAVLVASAGQVQAGIAVFTDRTTFMAALASSSIDDFNNLPAPQLISSPLNRTISSYQYDVTSPNGLFTVGSTSDIWLSNNGETDPMLFTVNSGGPTAIGGYFFTTDEPGSVTEGTISVSINGGLIEESKTTNSATNFFGFVSSDSTPISSFQINSASSGSDVFPTVNDLILGQAAATVPEPASLAVFGIGAGVMGLVPIRRGRREKQQETPT